MNIPLSYSKYSTFTMCPLRYTHSYLLKTKVEEELTYPLVLGQLTHLFIQLYNDNIYSKKQLRDLKDNLDALDGLIDLQYPAVSSTGIEIKKINILSNIEKLKAFVSDNEVVFFQAIKLFNLYTERFFPKINQSSNILSETTFHNVINITPDYSVCFYGSIDLLFYNIIDDILKYIYISDFKTGKALYPHYYEQLYFYIYNILNYNSDVAKTIVNNSDNISAMSYLANNIKDFSKVHLLLFNMRDGVSEKRVFSQVEAEYTKFIDKLMNDVSVNLLDLHKNKELLSIDDVYDKYKDIYKFDEAENCKSNELSFGCSFCKFKEDCTYRIKKIK